MGNMILGIGSQSAGTLLLYNILDQCTDIAMHPITELHYFDTLYGARDKSLLQEFSQNQFNYENNKFLNEYNQTFFNLRHETLLKTSKTLATENVEDIDYFSLFEPMSEESELLGEVTPEYMLLDDSKIEKMSSIIGKESKIILMVRHPVDRFFESLRMLLPSEFFNKNQRDFEKNLLIKMKEYPEWLEVQDLFNQYKNVYEQYIKYFDNVLILSYEGFKLDANHQLNLLQDFLQLPLDRENALSISTTCFLEKKENMKVSYSLNGLLEYRYKDSLVYLQEKFSTIYGKKVLIDKNTSLKLEKNIIKKETVIVHKINKFDYDKFLLVNKDIKKKLKNEDIKTIDIYLVQEGMEEIRKGLRHFHPDYMSFNESLYCKVFKDVKLEIRDENNPIESAFDHFSLKGYEQIISGRRLWPKDDKDERGKMGDIESIDLDYYWLKTAGVNHDLFYLFIFLTNLDENRYLDSNLDVKSAIASGDFENAADHIVYNGMNDFLAGHRNVYAGVDLKTSILGSVDNAYRIYNQGLFVSGWLYAIKEMGGIKKVYFSDGLYGKNITESLSFFPRSDLDSMIGGAHKKAGFYTYVNSKIIDISSMKRYALIVVTKNGVSQKIPLEVTEINSIKEMSQKILDPLQIDNDLYDNLTKNIGPVLCDYMEEYPLRIDEETIVREQFGLFVNSPKVSIIIPLYGRIDFVEYQLSQFANDPFFSQEVDLIYVLDDPNLTDELHTLAQGIYPIYDIPFSVVTYTQNYGYAVANNIGVWYARAPKLLLLNSDVMPLEKGWLPKLIETYDDLEDVGALAPKLLFEDGAVQHAGMVFEKSQAFKMWLNEHPGKGLPDLSTEENPKVVPAVTAACLLVDTLLYEMVGGLSDNYLIGDFEDSDFCLKLTENKKLSYYVPSVSLCHLERQSQNLFNDTSWKTKVTLFNGWQHNRKWDTLIRKLMETENAK